MIKLSSKDNSVQKEITKKRYLKNTGKKKRIKKKKE